MRRSKSKPEVAFQYGGRPCSETGSSNNSAVDWDISSKYGMLISLDLDIAKRVLSLKPKPEVDFRPYDRHLEKLMWRHNLAGGGPI